MIRTCYTKRKVYCMMTGIVIIVMASEFNLLLFRNTFFTYIQKKPDDHICYVNSFSDTALQDFGCQTDNTRLFQGVRFPNLSTYMDILGFDQYTECSQKTLESEIPVIVSAASQNHYQEAVALCNSLNTTLRKEFNNIKCVIFDLGITIIGNRESLQRYCGCRIESFPFNYFPNHVKNVQAYIWKPLVISLMLKHHPFVMWVDTSVRFDMNKNIRLLFKRARVCHIQQLTEPDWSIAETCDPKTMNFLQQNVSDFMNSTDVEAGWGVYIRSKYLMESIIRPWVLCALTYGCMLTDTYSFATGCAKTKVKHAGLCHRFEQSVLGIILTNIYKSDIYNILFGESKYGTIRRGDTLSMPASYLINKNSHMLSNGSKA